MDASFLQAKHSAGLNYDAYLQTGNPNQRESWGKIHQQLTLTPAQQQLLQSFTRKINVIALSGIWCGDCVQQGPMLAQIAQANPSCIDLRWLDRDQHRDVQQMVRINAGDRVPVVLFCAEDYELVGWFGDRTLQRYRAIAARQLGPSCPLPGAPVDGNELAATMQDWVEQFERVHLILRLSARLRQKHHD